jgi:hypothetical protein
VNLSTILRVTAVCESAEIAKVVLVNCVNKFVFCFFAVDKNILDELTSSMFIGIEPLSTLASPPRSRRGKGTPYRHS